MVKELSETPLYSLVDKVFLVVDGQATKLGDPFRFKRDGDLVCD